MPFNRQIEAAVKAAMTEYPVVTIVGPRQSGKTTLAKMLFPDRPYCSLENPSVRERAERDPEGFLAAFPNGAILDEVQRLPTLLSYIQGIVDERNESGLFVLTGSSNILLMQGVSQSLAGRCAIFTLLPFSLKESSVCMAGSIPLKSVLLGGYPRILANGVKSKSFFANYVDTYVERDVRQLLNVRNTLLFSRFIRLVAGRTGSMLDETSLSNDCGISTKTVREWISILQTSYICFLLPPWHENRGKRLVKSPKVYFYDTGLACALAGIDTVEQLERDPLRGGLFENLVILESMKRAYNAGERPNVYFYRDAKGVEVDMVEHVGGHLLPTEIKSAATFNPSFCKSLEKFRERYSDVCERPAVVYCGTENFTFKDIAVTSFNMNA